MLRSFFQLRRSQGTATPHTRFPPLVKYLPVAKELRIIINSNRSNPSHVNYNLYKLLLKQDILKMALVVPFHTVPPRPLRVVTNEACWHIALTSPYEHSASLFTSPEPPEGVDALRQGWARSTSPTRGPISLARDKNVSEAIESLRTERFYFMPGRRRQLPNRQRPLMMAVQRDMMILEAIRIILETVYEPIFLECSHGFRPLRSCHTALRKIRTSSRSHDWALASCLFWPATPGATRRSRAERMVTAMDPHVLIHLLEKKIGDKRFLRLIWKALRAGYGE